MVEQHVVVDTDYYQYYVYGVGGGFDESSVDEAHDGILAPGRQGVRVGTGRRMGPVEVTVRVLDGPLHLPTEDPDAVASACNLDLPEGVLAIHDFAGPARFEHDFGGPSVCAILVDSPVPLADGRWRTARMDRAGAAEQIFTDHVAQ